jgi:hypothetical protein
MERGEGEMEGEMRDETAFVVEVLELAFTSVYIYSQACETARGRQESHR